MIRIRKEIIFRKDQVKINSHSQFEIINLYGKSVNFFN